MRMVNSYGVDFVISNVTIIKILYLAPFQCNCVYGKLNLLTLGDVETICVIADRMLNVTSKLQCVKSWTIPYEFYFHFQFYDL